MTDLTTTGALRHLHTLATDARIQIDATWEAQRTQREAAERQAAVERAATYVQCSFPNTLAHVVSPQAWAGYRGLTVFGDGTETLPSAVAHLGDGVFVRHVHTYGFGGIDVLALWFPCGCGNYIEAIVGQEYDLADVLDDLDHTPCVAACTPSITFDDLADEAFEDDLPRIVNVLADLTDYSGQDAWPA